MNKMRKSETAASNPAGAEVTKGVEALLARMSLEEKVGQLAQIGGADWNQGPKPEDIILKGGAGSVLWLNDTKRFNELQKIARESGNPGLFIAIDQEGNLYAAGMFFIPPDNGNYTHYIARWDGAAWKPLGSGVDNFVHALAVDHEHLAQAQVLQLAAGVGQPVQVNVVDGDPRSAIFVHQRKRGAGDIVGACGLEPLGDSLDEGGLAGTEITTQQDEQRRGPLGGELPAQGDRLFRGIRDDVARHCGGPSIATRSSGNPD